MLVNGLADDLETWTGQVPALLEAGYRVLSFDNRGIGLSDKPLGPYTTAMLAADAKALVDQLQVTDFHLLGVSMGGMIAQEYALAYPDDLLSVTLACTYAAPGPFCSRMFSLWADMASVMGGFYPSGGINLGPALTFGYIAGRHAALASSMLHAGQPCVHPPG